MNNVLLWLFSSLEKPLLNKREWAALMLTGALVLAAYVAVAWLVEPGNHYRGIDTVDLVSIFNADDSFRYYLARKAFEAGELYQWNYILPVPLFLDGLVLKAVGEKIFHARVVFAVLSVITLLMLYRVKVQFGVRKPIAWASTVIVALMPVYAFVSMSFLGEKWLVVLIVAALFLYSKGARGWSLFFLSLLPLVRPEGFFFLLSFFIYFTYRRKWSYIAILSLPGTIYFLFLLASLPDAMTYVNWRSAYRDYTNHIYFSYLYSWYGFFVTFNLLWLAPSVVFFLFYKPRVAVLYVIGGWIVAIWYFFSISHEKSFYEPRYFMTLVPVIALYFSLWVNKFLLSYKNIRVAGCAIAAILIFILANHFLQVDDLRKHYTGGGRLPLNQNQQVYSANTGYDTESVTDIAWIMAHLPSIFEQNKSISRVFIPMQLDVFYLLDPAYFDSVKVAYLPIAYDGFVGIFGGSIFAIYPYGRQYSFFNLYHENFGGDKRLGLYIGSMGNCPVCLAYLKRGEIGLYPVYYSETRRPLRTPLKHEVFHVK